MSARRSIAILVATVCATWLMGIGALVGLRFSENFDVIESGVAYRSGQLLPDELDAVVRRSGIRSIVSLVPPEPDQSWYLGEIAVSVAQHLVRYEMPLSPRSELTSGELCRLLALLQNAPKPVLIHSKSGADRTGLAAAIYKYAIASRPADEARGQLSIRYGHFPYLVSGTGAMDASFQRFLLEQEAVGC
jgi:protein tyrosine/serine phosphatase